MPLKLPEPSQLSGTLQKLLGKPVSFYLSDGLSPKQSTGTVYVSLLTDDQDAVVGALMADLPAALFLGGTLIMLPVDSLGQLLRSGGASEMVLDGLSEVFNTLRATINHITGNSHVGYSNVVPFEEVVGNAWMLSPSSRLDLAGRFSFGDNVKEGKLSLLAR